MILLDLLISVFLLCILMVNGGEMSLPEFALILVIIAIAVLLFHIGGSWLLHNLFFVHEKPGDTRHTTRRRILHVKGMRTAQEKQLDAMNDGELREYLEHRPNDAVAVEILCERLRASGRLTEYARETEYLLTIESDMTIEEKCSRYHRLADLYLNDLARPERAREMLLAITSHFPTHYQATLARRRLEALRGDNEPETN